MTHSDPLERIGFRGRPAAHPASVVVSGQARFAALTDRLLRLEWSETGTFEDRSTYAFPTRYGPATSLDTRTEGEWLAIDTGALGVRYRQDSGPFAASNLSIAFDIGGERRVWRPGMAADGNLRGTRRTLDGCGGEAALEEGLVSRAGWALFDDSGAIAFDPADGWPAPRPDDRHQDWYFFGYGHDYRAALTDYTRFGGPVPLVPRYMLGAWWSRYWAYSDRELQDLVKGFSARDLPLDVLVLDMDWHTPHAWTGYTWNQDLFPDPAAFLDWAHRRGLRVTLNLHPAQGVGPHEEIYAHFARAMGLDPAGGGSIPFRITDRRFVRNYLELLHHPLEEQGVDFWWIDWQQGEASEMPGLDPLPWLNHLHFADARRRGRRPLIYSRWGGLGNHRTPIGFSGDTYVTWEALQFQPYMTATAANVAYGWWSHDIGGHMGGATDPELYARWVQFGALSPCLRLHSTKDPRAERRPWAYPPAVYRAARDAFHLRYRLLPTLYTLAREAYDTGLSPCRPMYYEHPEVEAAYAARNQYYLGEGTIAAPIVTPADPETGLAATDAWIPPGTWIDRQTGETFTGPRWARLVGDLDRVPVLLRAGAILPMAPLPPLPPEGHDAVPDPPTAAARVDRLILSVFPPAPGTTGAFRLYDDDGETEAYLDGDWEWTAIRTRMEEPDAWTVEIGPVAGRCEALPGERGYEIRLEGSRAPQRVTVDGAEARDWHYDPAALTTSIRVPARSKGQAIRVTAVAPGGISALGEAHNRAIAVADVRRLLGERCPTDPEDVDAVLGATGPGQLDAVARLGGPFAHFVEFSTPEEASRQLGRLIVGAPAPGGGPFDLEATFRLVRGGDREEHKVVIRGASEAQIVDTPFAWDGRVRPARWQAEVEITWRGQRLPHRHRSRTLFPTIYAWWARLTDPKHEPDPLAWAPAGEGGAEARGWTPFIQRADPEAGPSVQSLVDAHVVRLDEAFRDRLAAGDPPVAAVATTIISPTAREAVLHAWTRGRAVWHLDGREIEMGPPAEEMTHRPPFYGPTARSAVLRLRAGENRLLAISRPAKETRMSTGLPSWRLGATLTTPAGEPLAGLAYR